MITKEYLEQKYLFENKTTYEIATLLNVSQPKVSYWLAKHAIKTRKTSGGGKRFIDLTNKTFGRLTVVGVDKRAGENHNRKTIWECKCECGKTVFVWTNSLLRGATKSCSCLRKEMMFKGCNDLSGCYWARVVKGAKTRNLELSISIEDAWQQFQKQNKRCALTGIRIELARDLTRKRHNNTASLDRIDNNKGYTKDNIQWVHRDINIMRNNFTIQEFLDYCRKVVEHNEQSEPSDGRGTPSIP